MTHAEDTEDTSTWTEIEEPAPGEVRRVGTWAVGTSRGEPFAVGRRCRHQLRDLSDGRVDDDGCLVCPWHGARYDVRNGEMVGGPRGIAFYVGPTPGYTQLVRVLARWVPLRVGRAVRWGRGRLRVR
ncbi:Rieske (2Fe-2S) protein [Actinomycetospora lemnae]|uniref:Rieske 2Fe-2S domain-containing protein n=1 Tax=Actinomycetospora lemnae TaxID=3019891 RepID=A0ABT5SN36_9PSEU|nr:Rieske 2Fe-2S domain-containing protein [Actinomycetospora sp. DW7H6]MDD7963890.1 Rieske 2Fe-2S domain-containing protein [Actinomycetospora sp. DW7H6]